jgi:hypothetical protein
MSVTGRPVKKQNTGGPIPKTGYRPRNWRRRRIFQLTFQVVNYSLQFPARMEKVGQAFPRPQAAIHLQSQTRRVAALPRLKRMADEK